MRTLTKYAADTTPVQAGDLGLWNGTLETSRFTVERVEDGVAFLAYDRYQKHGPKILTVPVTEMEAPHSLYFRRAD